MSHAPEYRIRDWIGLGRPLQLILTRLRESNRKKRPEKGRDEMTGIKFQSRTSPNVRANERKIKTGQRMSFPCHSIDRLTGAVVACMHTNILNANWKPSNAGEYAYNYWLVDELDFDYHSIERIYNLRILELSVRTFGRLLVVYWFSLLMVMKFWRCICEYSWLLHVQPYLGAHTAQVRYREYLNRGNMSINQQSCGPTRGRSYQLTIVS